ncbi:MAG: metal-sensing transcriptional repressor [Bacilli bacterium]
MKCNPDLLHRMKRLHGQMKGILAMMENQDSCQDLVVQLKAIRVNLDKTISLITTENLQQIMLDKPADTKAIQDAMDLIVKSR